MGEGRKWFITVFSELLQWENRTHVKLLISSWILVYNAPWWNPSFDKLLCLLCVDFTPLPVTCDPAASTSTPPLPAHETSSSPRSVPFYSFVNRHIRIRSQCYLLFWYASESSVSFPVLPAFALCANCQGSQWRVSSVWRPGRVLCWCPEKLAEKLFIRCHDDRRHPRWEPSFSRDCAVMLECSGNRERTCECFGKEKNDKRKKKDRPK